MKQQDFDTIISSFNSDIVCGIAVGCKIQDSPLYKPKKVKIEEVTSGNVYKIGLFNSKEVFIDPMVKWKDLKIYNTEGDFLVDISDYVSSPHELV